MKKLFLKIIIISVFASSTLHAQDTFQNKVSISISASAYKYDEVYKYDPSDFSELTAIGLVYRFKRGEEIPVMELKGEFIAAEMNYKHYLNQKIILSPSVQYRYGFLKYSSDYYKRLGANIGTITISGVRDHVLQLECEGGYVVSLAKIHFIPQIGFGFRFLYDNQENGNVEVDGMEHALYKSYNRISRYLYIPVGVELAYNVSDKSLLSFMARYNYFIQGKQTSFLSKINEMYNDLHSVQKSGYGVNTYLYFEYSLGACNSIFIKPFFELWNIGKSEGADPTKDPDIEQQWFEPQNKTTNAGLSLGVAF